MIQAVILDDEILCLNVLNELIKEHYPAIEAISFDNAFEGIDYINTHDIQLLFLDINMPLVNGFDVLDKLMPFSFKVIFTTAYDSYAIKALKYGAIDYLLKPIAIEDLKVPMTKFYDSIRFEKHDKTNVKEKKKIAITNSDGIIFQSVSDILFCEAENSYTIFHLTNGKKLIASTTLKEFDAVLSKCDFYRVHNSYLVNLEYIDKYVKGENGGIMIKDRLIPISRSKKDEFLNVIKDFIN